VAALNDAVDPRVEASQQIDTGGDLGSSLAVTPQVGGLLGEEVGAETLVSVQEDAVHIIVALDAGVLAKELHLVNKVTALGTFRGRGLLGLLIEDLDAVIDISRLDLHNVEASAESSGRGVGLME